MAAARAGYGSNGGRVGGGQLDSFKNRINVGDIPVTPTAQTRQLLYGESRRRFRESVARRATVEPRSKKAASSQATQMPRFDGHARAIRCARAIRSCARAIRDSVKELGIDIRAGLHTGECEQIDGKVGGIAVITGARIAAQAGPNEILVSATVRDLVAGSGLEFEDRGVHSLSGLSEENHLYAVAG